MLRKPGGRGFFLGRPCAIVTGITEHLGVFQTLFFILFFIRALKGSAGGRGGGFRYRNLLASVLGWIFVVGGILLGWGGGGGFPLYLLPGIGV